MSSILFDFRERDKTEGSGGRVDGAAREKSKS